MTYKRGVSAALSPRCRSLGLQETGFTLTKSDESLNLVAPLDYIFLRVGSTVLCPPALFRFVPLQATHCNYSFA